MKTLLLTIAATVSLAAFYTLTAWGQIVARDPESTAAVERYIAASRALAQARSQHVAEEHLRELARTDPQNTGLIGIEWSSYTTTSGDLAAKRHSASPEWAAVFVEWYREMGLEPGDKVAIGASASFPAMLLAARAAAEASSIEPVVIASLTSSTYGANIPGFDIWDMERILLEEGLVEYPVRVLSLGGDGDLALYLEEEDRAFLLQRLDTIQASNPDLRVILPTTIVESVGLRDEIFFPGNDRGDCRLFVNIGGHAANLGTGMSALSIPRGPIRPVTRGSIGWSGDSVLLRAVRRGVPAINILDVRGLASDRGVSPTYDIARSDGVRQHHPAVRAFAAALSALLLLGLLLCERRSPAWNWHKLTRMEPQ